MKRPKIFLVLAGVCLMGLSLRAEQNSRIIDTRGPVQNTGMTVKVDDEGVQAPGYVWPKPEEKKSWSAQWIVSSAPAVPDSAAVCLRKEITLAHEPKKVTAWITSDNYLLYINGKPRWAWPCRCRARFYRRDQWSPFLRLS